MKEIHEEARRAHKEQFPVGMCCTVGALGISGLAGKYVDVMCERGHETRHEESWLKGRLSVRKREAIPAFRHLFAQRLRGGKYTSRFADLTEDQLECLLWIAGEIGVRLHREDYDAAAARTSREFRKAFALKQLHLFTYGAFDMKVYRGRLAGATRK